MSYKDDWYAPVRMYTAGYPPQITSALRELPELRQIVRGEVVALSPALTLEVGPGDAPVTEGIGRVVYLDLVHDFLRRLSGLRVRANLLEAPFEAGTFDVVLAADVLTHIRPALRLDALAALTALGRNLVIFNPELGSVVPGSRVRSRPIHKFLTERGFKVSMRKFVAYMEFDARNLLLFTAVR